MTAVPGFPDVLRSEWTKLTSLRSTGLVLALGLALGLGLAALLAVVIGATWDEASAADRAAFDPLDIGRVGGLSVFVFAVLGVTAATSEHTSGTIRPTLIATPRRGRVLAAKAAVVAGVTLVAGLVTVLASFLLAQAVLGSYGLATAGLGEGGARRTLLADGLLAPLMPVCGLALGVALRSAAGAVASLAAFVLLPAFLGGLLPAWWQEHVLRFTPVEASEALAVGSLEAGTGALPPGTALVVLAAWLALFLAGAWAVLERRDA